MATVGTTVGRLPLAPGELYTSCDPSKFNFQTTAELPDFTEMVGQERALEAMRFGVGIRRPGFNLFLLGPGGTGKFGAVREFLKKRAAAPSPGPSEERGAI